MSYQRVKQNALKKINRKRVTLVIPQYTSQYLKSTTLVCLELNSSDDAMEWGTNLMCGLTLTVDFGDVPLCSDKTLKFFSNYPGFITIRLTTLHSNTRKVVKTRGRNTFSSFS